MPFDLSTTAILAIYTLIFLAQIYVVSIHYPRILANRGQQVIRQFPPKDYPKLYPDAHDAGYADRLLGRLNRFRMVNYFIALIGLVLVGYMHLGGFEPSPKGGAEIYVIAYFFLQAAPLMLASFREYAQYKQLRATFNESKRSAELAPRRLFGFIAPGYVFTAVVLYVVWALFLFGATPEGSTASGDERLLAFAVISFMNAGYAFTVFRQLNGQKVNPYLTAVDQNRSIGTMIRVLVLSSIGCSLFLILTQAADIYAFEAFDPVMTSIFMQLCVIFGVGETFRRMRLEDLDFSVYRESPKGSHA